MTPDEETTRNLNSNDPRARTLGAVQYIRRRIKDNFPFSRITESNDNLLIDMPIGIGEIVKYELRSRNGKLLCTGKYDPVIKIEAHAKDDGIERACQEARKLILQ